MHCPLPWLLHVLSISCFKVGLQNLNWEFGLQEPKLMRKRVVSQGNSPPPQKLKWRHGGQWQLVCPSSLWCRAPAQKLIKASGPSHGWLVGGALPSHKHRGLPGFVDLCLGAQACSEQARSSPCGAVVLWLLPSPCPCGEMGTNPWPVSPGQPSSRGHSA